MNIVVVREPITRAQALLIAKEIYHDMVKGVIDIEQSIIALGGEYHIDAEQKLLEEGSRQSDVWFNVYPLREDETWIEFTSLINVRPQAGNKSMTIEDRMLRDTIRVIVERLII